ncbi:Eukaryotic rRNA processing protein EBP2 [Giardia muris]|uniref:Eukaryotic rRNA processing protein EBP2 n=1 Tax=Giardia muris TaxID=5742 RepID=A0A4Z1SR51_GIAMU|nr:Eukaryotic rRNA processing protein EBP2 [Giardia muris]|eukprot:TNJ28180.1 Eukaryotic rRNA processing protein EBP2 [Giardia muris]
MDERLRLALGVILPQEEHFLDYLAVTARSPDGVDDDETEAAIQTQAASAVAQAKRAFKKLDLPFYPPPDYTAEMYRSETTMQRLASRDRATAEALKVKEQRRALKMQVRLKKQLKHDRSSTRIKSERIQREFLKKWREERTQLRKQGVGEEELPTLEQAEAKFVRMRRAIRRSKNIKYSGRKDYGKPRRLLKKNDTKGLNDDPYINPQFGNSRRFSSGSRPFSGTKKK